MKRMEIQLKWIKSCHFGYEGVYYRRYVLHDQTIKFVKIHNFNYSVALIEDNDLIQILEKEYISQCANPEVEKVYTFH